MENGLPGETLLRNHSHTTPYGNNGFLVIIKTMKTLLWRHSYNKLYLNRSNLRVTHSLNQSHQARFII
jgi:hypothetical protein